MTSQKHNAMYLLAHHIQACRIHAPDGLLGYHASQIVEVPCFLQRCSCPLKQAMHPRHSLCVIATDAQEHLQGRAGSAGVLPQPQRGAWLPRPRQHPAEHLQGSAGPRAHRQAGQLWLRGSCTAQASRVRLSSSHACSQNLSAGRRHERREDCSS